MVVRMGGATSKTVVWLLFLSAMLELSALEAAKVPNRPLIRRPVREPESPRQEARQAMAPSPKLLSWLKVEARGLMAQNTAPKLPGSARSCLLAVYVRDHTYFRHREC